MNRFKLAYAECLKRAVAEHPKEYWWTTENVIHGNTGDKIIPADTIENITAKLFAAMDKKNYNKDGRAFKMACKQLGIPHTYKAINEVLAEGN